MLSSAKSTSGKMLAESSTPPKGGITDAPPRFRIVLQDDPDRRSVRDKLPSSIPHGDECKDEPVLVESLLPDKPPQLLRQVGYEKVTREVLRTVAVNEGLATYNGRSGGWENYTVRLVGTGYLASGTSGVIAQSFVCDPSVSSLSEWSNFASLFDEVRCLGFKVQLATVSDPATVLVGTPLQIGSFTRTTATPPTRAAVAVAPDSAMVPFPNTTSTCYTHVMKYPKDILWAATSSPTGGPWAGCPGSIQVYSDSNTASQSLFAYTIVGKYALRGRL